MKNATSIFYVNSMGFMAQWKGSVIAQDDKSISIRFSKNKACKFNLKDLGADFLLVTKTPVKSLGVSVTETAQAVSFDERLQQIVLDKTVGNVQSFWHKGKWEV